MQHHGNLLVHAGIAERVSPPLAAIYRDKGVELRGCERTRALLGSDVIEATEQDWYTEYTAPILSIRIVDDLDQAIEHINTYGSKHTDAIVSEHFSDARRFLTEVDSASVMINASTRFADGFEYGLGQDWDFHGQAACPWPGGPGRPGPARSTWSLAMVMCALDG